MLTPEPVAPDSLVVRLGLVIGLRIDGGAADDVIGCYVPPLDLFGYVAVNHFVIHVNQPH